MRSLSLLVLFTAGILATPAHAKTLTVFAAASTVQVLDKIRNAWNRHNAVQLRIVYGSSGALARQIKNGAPADVYFSANSSWVDYLVKQGIAQSDTRQTIFGNRIVLIAPALAQLPAPFNMKTDIRTALGKNGRLAIGDPQHVPAGIYGRQALLAVGQRPLLMRRTVQTQNVRLALALVQRGEAPLGIVYYTDAIQTAQVRIILTIDSSLHAPIEYQAIVTASGDADSRKLLTHLTSAASRETYRKFGFLTSYPLDD